MILTIEINNYKKYLKYKSGVYMIRNIYNNHKYIGSTGDLYYRLWQHRNSLLKGIHVNKHLQNSVNKHGLDLFEFKVLKFTILSEKLILMKEEQFFIDYYKPEFNKQPFAYINRGYKHTIEAIEKIRCSGLGRKTNNRPVLQFDKQGTFIKEYSSIREAILETNITSVHFVCRYYEVGGIKRTSAGGYIWKYKNRKVGQ